MEFIDNKARIFEVTKTKHDVLFWYNTDSFNNEAWIPEDDNAPSIWADALLNACREKKPPRFQGNWAYVYICKDYWLAAVDHYASINLFFSEKIITHNWNLIKQKPNDNIGIEQQRVLRRMLVGSRTTVKNVKRIPPGCYAINGEIHEYANFRELSFPDSKQVVKSFDRVTNHIKGLVLYSGGTDSYMLACQGQDKHRYITITSPNIKYNFQIPKPGIVTKEYEVEPEISWSDDFITEPTMNYKIQTLEKAGENRFGQYVLTGETGNAPLMATHLVHAYVNDPSISLQRYADSAIRLLRHDTHTWNVGEQDDTLENDYPDGYKEISEHFINKLKDTRYDMLRKLVTIYGEEHTNYRLYPYSQNLRWSWYHPFSTALWASCYFQNEIVANPKKHLLYIVATRKNFPMQPWTVPKVGMSIPTKEKYVRTKT